MDEVQAARMMEVLESIERLLVRVADAVEMIEVKD